MSISKKYRFLKATSKVYKSGVILLALRLLNTIRAAAGREKTNHLPNKTLMGPLTVSTCLLIFEPWHREVFWTCAVRLFAHFPSQLQTGQTLLIQEIFSSLTKALEAHTHCVFVLFISLWCSGFIFLCKNIHPCPWLVRLATPPFSTRTRSSQVIATFVRLLILIADVGISETR